MILYLLVMNEYLTKLRISNIPLTLGKLLNLGNEAQHVLL